MTMVQIKCDKCGMILHEPIFRLIMTDGQVTKEAQFCEEHGQKLHDVIMRYAAFIKKADDETVELD